MLTLLHARPGHPWTLEELAREALSSRSSLGKRFAELVGQPPMQYLAQWRMQVAANLLAQSGAKIATIGREVGTIPRPRLAERSRSPPDPPPALGARFVAAQAVPSTSRSRGNRSAESSSSIAAAESAGQK